MFPSFKHLTNTGVANLLIPCVNIFTLNLDAPHQASISFQFFKTRACNIDEEQKKGLHFTPSDSGAPRIWQRGATTGGLGVKPQPPMDFYGFHVKKTLILAHFFYQKRVCSECSHYRQCKNIFAAYV